MDGGVVLMGSTFQNDTIKASIVKHLGDLPIVMANGYLELPNVYGILADEQNGVSNCVELLHSKGRTNLAFMIDNYTPSNKLKKQGFTEAVTRLGVADRACVYRAASTLKGAYNATKN